MKSWIKGLLVRWVILSIALIVAARIMPGVEIQGGIVGVVIAGAAFGLVNAVLGPLLRLVSLPFTLATFGIFALVVNGVLLAIAAALTDDLSVGGPLGTMVAALVIAVLSTIGHFIARMIPGGSL